MLKENPGPKCNVEFSASSGLFKRFKDHYSIDNVEVSGESASVDVKAAEIFFENSR